MYVVCEFECITSLNFELFVRPRTAMEIFFYARGRVSLRVCHRDFFRLLRFLLYSLGTFQFFSAFRRFASFSFSAAAAAAAAFSRSDEKSFEISKLQAAMKASRFDSFI